MLELKDVHVSYGKSKVINGIDFSMETTEKVALLGRNGVGKNHIAEKFNWCTASRVRRNQI